MPKIVPGGRTGWLGETNTPAANTLAQWRAMVSALRQLIGGANIADGGSESTDPLTAPFQLYVDFDIGRDTFVTGDFNTYEASGTAEEIIAQKLKRLRNQRLECGYSKHAPFKTLNRAVLEAAIITSLNWYTYSDARAHRDCVIIHMGAGPQPLYNHPGSHASAVSLTTWADGKIPTWQELIKFNDDTLGGVILPRGAAFCGEDLRKTTLVPQWAPTPADIASDWSNIRCALYLTPDVHAVDFTFRDPPNQNQSLHLLFALGYPSQAHLNGFYTKVQTSLGSSANLSSALLAARTSEYQVVGPFADTPTIAWDTTKGASAYPERISLRSDWGMGGLFINGDNLGGLKSSVTAQFTGVSLQTDLNSLQIYAGGAWVTPSTYQAYINADPNSRRIKPTRAHHHLLVINDAFVSEVSVFGVGHTARARADLGGEIVSSNGNFTFGSCAALATGYRRNSFPQDKSWVVDRISVPLNPIDKVPAIRRIALGVVAAHTASTITLVQGLAADAAGTTPQILAKDQYSLPSATYVWVENSDGDDWRALVTASAWASGAPTIINITAALSQSGTNAAVPVASGVSKAIGKQVYIRRVVDSRTLSERSASLELSTSAGSRTPVRSAILQTSLGVSGGGITRALAVNGEEVVAVTTSVKITGGARITLRRGCPSRNYVVGEFYRKGTTVKALNKHWISVRDVYAVEAAPPAADWDEVYVHMPEAYNPAERDFNEAPQVVYNTDTDPNDATTACGINWSTIFTNSGTVRDQYRSGSDVLGLYAFLRALGFTDTDAWAALTPRAAASRRLNPASATDFPTAPSGGAASGRARWAVELRRPTTITLSNFTFDVGAGRGNYSTGLPSAQKTLSPSNQFSLYFTTGGGGRVVVRGCNEDGQEVTNYGLSEAETGDVTLSGDIAGGETDSATSSFRDISINGLVGSGVWDLSGVSTLLLPSVNPGSTTALGPVKLANAAALRSSNTIAGANDAALDANIDATPEVVTLKGLNYWARNAGVLTRRTGVVTLYVVPDSATAAGQTFNFDGTSATLTLNPVRSTAEVFDAPPLTGATAVTFAVAVAYANAVFSPEETVRYQLANGPYWNSPAAFGHKADVVGATARFSETAVVASYTSANTKPTTDVKALHDARSPFLVPCFATGISLSLSTFQQFVSGVAVPFVLNLPYGGTVRAVCWLSASATLADTTNFPSDPIYSAASRSYRTPGVSLANFVDNYFDGAVSSGFTVYGFWSDLNILVGKGTLYLRDIVFGAKSPSVQSDTRSCNVWVAGDAEVYSGGIYFLGNTSLTTASLPKAIAKGITVTNALGLLNSQFYISSSAGSASRTLRVGFTAYFGNNPDSVGSTDKNFDTNCIHILDDNGNYGLVANRSATNGTRGAAMSGFIGNLAFGSTLITGGYASWFSGFTNPNKHYGIAGAFGNYSYSISNVTDQPCVGLIVQEGLKIAREPSYNNSLWQMATSGALLTSNVTLTSTPGGSQVSYDFAYNNAANLKISAFYKGIDVNNGTQVLGSLPSNRFFG